MNNALDDDPFDGYGLAEETRESEPAVVSPAPAPAPERTPEPQRYELPPPAAFEVQPRCGPVRCEDCYHYVAGGTLTIERIYEAEQASLYDLVAQCKDFEKSFEVRELKEIVEKAKTLDEKFDMRPRIRGYCAAGHADSDSLHFIAEIKNHDGRCTDFLPGRPPIVSCSECAHRKPAMEQPPSLADYPVDFGDQSIGFEYDDVHASLMSGYISAMRGQYERQDAYYRRDEQQYNQKLHNDITDAIFNDRSPDNYTLDHCNRYPFRACAVANRSLRCTDFKTHEEQRFEDMQARMDKLVPLPKKDPPADREGKNRRAWMALRMRNPEYSAAGDRVRQAQLDRILQTKSVPLTEEQRRIPCFDCVHRRDPVKIDPFTTVHFNTPEIMNIRDEYRLEQARRTNEERRICGMPGPSLGEAEVPSQHIWCDLHSRRQADGTVQEYAYCYRVLKALAPQGQCPGYRDRSKKAE